VRAAFLDAQGPRIWRFVPYAFPLALLLSAAFVPVQPATAGLIAVIALTGVNLAGLLPVRQRSKRAAEVVCGPGYVDVLRAGTRTQRIHTKSLVGATTARTRDGVLFTLSHARRDEPILLEVESDADADRVRHALGIGHGGFGRIGWRTVLGGATKAAIVGRVLSTLLGALIVAIGVAASPEAALLSGLALGQFALLGFVLSAIGWFSGPVEPTIIMAAEGLRIFTTRGWFMLPYAQVLGVEYQKGHLLFQVPPPWHQVAVQVSGGWLGTGLSPDDRATLIAQIRTAAERARGLGPQKNDPTGRLDVLRRKGENVRDWLVRLDMAGQTLASGSGYRGNTLEPEDLWAILEDPEAEPELRAAAARILKHSSLPESRVRIDAAVAAVRDDRVNRKLRIAIDDDLDAATRDLAILEAEETRSHAPPNLPFAQVR
jgi:hypothetical protein